jgi:hypothetical protein
LVFAQLAGGALLHYGPAPLYADYWVLLAVVAVVLAAVWLLPSGEGRGRAGSWRPRRLLVPSERRSVFLGGVLGIADAYAIGAVYVGLGTQIGKALLHSANSLVDGAVIALSAAALGIVAMLSRQVKQESSAVGSTDRFLTRRATRSARLNE